MRRTALRLALFVGILAIPIAAYADVPMNVRGLSAHFANGQINMQWEAPENADDVAVYRVYESQKSILENNGEYDDFITVGGKLTHFILTDIPAYPQLYLAVTAVNHDGEESASFVEEVHVDLTVAESEGERLEQETASPSRLQQEAKTVGLLSAKSQSPTEVLLTFSVPVSISQEQAQEAFAIVDTDGNPLRLLRLAIDGDKVILTTEPQAPGKRYGIRVSPVLSGNPDTGSNMALDSARSQAVFEGFGDVPVPEGNTSSDNQDASIDPNAEREVRSFRVSVQPENTRRATVIIGWDAPTIGMVSAYRITPILADRAKGKTRDVPADTRVVRMQGIPVGTLLFQIQVVDVDGSVTPGVTTSVLVAGTTGSTGTNALTHTGAGTLGILLVSGGIAGWRKRRKSAR